MKTTFTQIQGLRCLAPNIHPFVYKTYPNGMDPMQLSGRITRPTDPRSHEEYFVGTSGMIEKNAVDLIS